MESYLLLLSFIIAFLVTLYLTPRMMKVFYKRKVVLLFGTDVNKKERPKVPSFGGIAIVTAFMFGVSVNILIRELFQLGGLNLTYLLPGLLAVSLIAFLGLVDDIYVIPVRWIKPMISLYACIPMMAINFGPERTMMAIPFFGQMNFGLLYAFIFVPVAIIFCANAFNILEGFNGIASGMGLVMSFGLIIITLIKGETTGALFLITLFATLAIFYYYNKVPALVFPGDVGTLFIGACIAVSAIIGNAERALVIMMIPYFIHFLLYSRNLFKFKPQAYGTPQKDGTLKCKYKKSYGLTHFIMLHFKKVTEKKIVYLLFAFEAVFVVLGVMLELFL